MKHPLSLTLIAGIAILLPATLFAENDDNGKKADKKDSKNHGHDAQAVQQQASQGKSQSNGKSHSDRQSHSDSSHSDRQRSGSTVVESNQVRQSSGSVQPSKHSQQTQVYQKSSSQPSYQRNYQGAKQSGASVSSQSYQPSSRYETSSNSSSRYQSDSRHQSYSGGQVQVTTSDHYNRSNNYGGLWYSGDTHHDWNRDGEHYYNHHNYRWYEGGWLIIDAGFNPYYSERVYSTGYTTGHITGRNVQIRLAERGYYRGPIDGDIGPGTRNSIANFQADYGLRVTGRVDTPLLQYLGIN